MVRLMSLHFDRVRNMSLYSVKELKIVADHRMLFEAIKAGDKDAAATALKAAQPEMARGVAKGVLHKNTVARKYSRLTKSVNAIA